MKASTSLTNSLRSLAFNDRVPFQCEWTASTIAALAANFLTAVPLLVCTILGIVALPFGPWAFGWAWISCRWEARCLSSSSGRFGSLDRYRCRVGLVGLKNAQLLGGTEGNAPDPPAGSAVRARTGDSLPKTASCGEPALMTFAVTVKFPGTSQERLIGPSWTDSFHSHHSDAYVRTQPHR